MVVERTALRVTSLVYIQGDDEERQRQLATRWNLLHKVRVLDVYVDKAQRLALSRMLERLSDGRRRGVDYVLTYSPAQFGATKTRAREVQRLCEAYGARVIYTSR